MAPLIILLIIVCGGAAVHKKVDCSTTTKPGFSCSCSGGDGGSDISCKDVNECASNMTNHCDRTTSKCVNTYGGYECQCLHGYIKDINGDTCVKPVVHVGLVDPELFSCCSSRSSMGGLVVKVIKTPSGQLFDMQKVACIHPTSKKTTTANREYSRALEVSSKEVQNIVMAFAKSVQKKYSAASVDVLSHFKFGGCYRTVSFFTGDKSIVTTKPMYYEAEKLTTYKSLPNGNCIVFRKDQHYLTEHLITVTGEKLSACTSGKNSGVTTTTKRVSLLHIPILFLFVLYK